MSGGQHQWWCWKHQWATAMLMNWERCATQLAYVALGWNGIVLASSNLFATKWRVVSWTNSKLHGLPETEDWWLEDKPSFWGSLPGRGELFVSGGFTMTLRRFKSMERKRSCRQMGADISRFFVGMSRSFHGCFFENGEAIVHKNDIPFLP